MPQSNKFVEPFIRRIEPYVGHKHLSIKPNIGCLYPSVAFGGFTLIELMAVLVMAGILAALAAPAMSTFITNQRISGEVNELLGDLNFARSEAVRRSTNVTVCKTLNPDAATPSCNTTVGDPWTSGRIIFVDPANTGTVDAGEQILRIRQALDGASSTGNTLIRDTTVGDAKLALYVPFSSTGMTTFTGGEGELVFCDKRGNSQAIAVAISTTGRARATPKGKNLNGANLAVCP